MNVDKKPSKISDDLSPEERDLKILLENCVETLSKNDGRRYAKALEQMRTVIQQATTSMTAIPKPLKFLLPHYQTMKSVCDKIKDATLKKECADIVSALAMTDSQEGTLDCLNYKLMGKTSMRDCKQWGHEYLNHLSAQIARKWSSDGVKQKERKSILSLVESVVRAQMEYRAEIEACDLMLEVMDAMPFGVLIETIDKDNFEKVCTYLIGCSQYISHPENEPILTAILDIFKKFDSLPQALRMAMDLKDDKVVKQIFKLAKPDKTLTNQLSLLMAKQDRGEAELQSNIILHDHFIEMARRLEILEPRDPEDIFKSNFDQVQSIFEVGVSLDVAKQNLAKTLVSCFANAGFGNDCLLSDDKGSSWLFKHKKRNLMTATAGIGLLNLWNPDEGLSKIDKYLSSSNDDYTQSGALLALGLCCCSVVHEVDPAKAILGEELNKSNNVKKLGASLGMGIAYAGSKRKDVIKDLDPLLSDSSISPGLKATVALSMGLVMAGSGDKETIKILLKFLQENGNETEFKNNPQFTQYFALAMGMICIGIKDKVDDFDFKELNEPYLYMVSTMCNCCAFAGSGDVLKTQELLHFIADPDGSKKDNMVRIPIAVIGLSILSIGDEIGSDMLTRTFGHMLRYCDVHAKRSVPLALGLLSVSNPQLNILETLAKFSHDSDSAVAMSSIFAIGLLSAGTSNARVGKTLRQLAIYHLRDAEVLFVVRIAQALL